MFCIHTDDIVWRYLTSDFISWYTLLLSIKRFVVIMVVENVCPLGVELGQDSQ